MNPIIVEILLSMLPVLELRAGIPYALSNNVGTATALIVAIIFNSLIVLPLFLFLDYLHHHFMRIRIYRRLFNLYLRRVQRKISKANLSWPYLALFLFVALPLPGTGAYTGTLVAWLLELNRKKSIMTIFFAVIIAGILVTLASLGLIRLFL